MLTFRDGILDKVNKWNDNYYVLTDFDRTLTAGDSESSWGVLSNDNEVPEEYIKERKEYFDYYHPYEIDLSLDNEIKNELMIEWWTKHIGLFVKYGFKEDVINNAVNNINVMKFREGAKEFLKRMHEKNIPVIIISAGIGNFVEQYLIRNDSMYDNIYIVANFIRFENGVAIGISNNIIHSLNKNEVSIPNEIKALILKRENVVLLGDHIDDVKMVSEEKRSEALKIGFLNDNKESDKEIFLEKYDIIGDENATFTELRDALEIFK